MRFALALFLLLCAAPALAADNAALEQQAAGITRNLRCPVCEGQSVAESAAPLAADLRHLVRAQLAAGKTERQIYDLVREKYGDAALFMPPARVSTMPLWLAPALIFLCGLGFASLQLRRRR